jgi:hypothetical protein
VRFPLFVAGVDATEPFVTSRGARVALERADLAFGPLYLCAGSQAGTSCDRARVEWLGSAVVRAKSDRSELVGELTGVSGPIGSYMYDHGFTSLLTAREPLATSAAVALGNTSLVLTGSAEIDGLVIPFAADVPIRLGPDSEPGVSVVQKGSSEDFRHEITTAEVGLRVRFDPRVWLDDVDFASLHRACTGEPCAIEGDTQAFRAIHNAVVSGTRPRFEWRYTP